MSAIPAPAHSPPEQWPDDEFPLPTGQDLLSYSRNRSSLASQLTWDDSENGGSSAGNSPVKGEHAREEHAEQEEEQEEDWDEGLDVSAPVIPLAGRITGSVTRLGSHSPAPVPVQEDDGFDFADAPPSSALRLKMRLPSAQLVDDLDLDWDEDEERAETLKPALVLPSAGIAGLGLRNVPSLAEKAGLLPTPSAEEDDFEAAFALSPEVNFLALPPSDSAHVTPGKESTSTWNVTSTTAFSPAPSSLFQASPSLSLNTPSTSTAGSSQGDSLSCPGSPVPSASTGPSTHGDSADYLPEHDPPAVPDLPALSDLHLHDSPISTLPEPENDLDADVLFPAHLTATGMRALLERRKARAEEAAALLSPRSQEDEPFEHGLLIGNDDDLSPSRLRAARAASAGRSMIPIAASRQPSAQRRPPSSTYLSPPPTLPRTTGVAAGLAHRKSASRLQSPSPSSRPAPLPSTKPVIRRKASLGTMLPSSAAAATGSGHARKKTGSSTSSQESIPPVPPLPANLHNLHIATSPTSSLRRPPSAGSSAILSPRSPSPAPSVPATSSSSNGSHGPSSSRLTSATQSSLAKHRTQPTRRSEPPVLGQLPLGKKTPPRQRGKLAGLWPGVSPTTSSSSVSTPSPPKPQPQAKDSNAHQQQGPVARLLRRPRGMDKRGGRVWGTGKELDGIEDLPVGKEELKSPPASAAPSAWGGTLRSRGRVSPLPPSAAAPAAKQGRGMFSLRQPQPQAQSHPQPAAKLPTQPKRHTGPPVQPVVLPKAARETTRPKSRTSPGRLEKENDRRRGPTLIRDLGSVGLPRTQNGMKWNPTKQRWDGQEHLLRVFEPPLSARPALITHLSSSATSPLFKSLGLAGAVGAMRVVGEMMFDPIEMRWLRRDGAEEEDVFKHVEEESSVGSEFGPELHEQQHTYEGAGTIRAARAGLLHLPEAPGNAAIDPDLVKQCKDAEARHRAELAGWLGGMESVPASPVDDDEQADKHHRWLWDIRALATQDYGA
ncbi:hypothetical protein CALCODRAFT_284287 [Calocera cornea HHB12733]|uniref:Uncharacterized protein n=1 Tax=Calocera cornea HHB12733 TaxID=1353952 RepID=A0A165FZF7_9BASI|nr:hypothetical protein CALCODRAFT_284287 [Calocera cornea HHB12733]